MSDRYTLFCMQIIDKESNVMIGIRKKIMYINIVLKPKK